MIFEPQTTSSKCSRGPHRNRTVAGHGQLWEREPELARIGTAIDGVRGGASRLLVIEGPAGIGKTQLLLSAARAAKLAGVRTLSARATELEHGFPFGIARQWLEPLLTRASADQREALLDGAAGLAEPVLAPDADAAPIRVESAVHGLYWLLANLSASSPLVLLLDDAQWADDSSLRLLNYLAPRADGLALGLVIACRPPGSGEAALLLDHLMADPFAELLHPAPLGTDAAAGVLLSATGSEPEEEFVSAALAATGGNPFYLKELGRTLRSEGIAPTDEHVDQIPLIRPHTLSRAMLARLSPDARALARAVAVLDEHADVALAGALAGLRFEQASKATDELTRAGLLIDARPLQFRHAIVRGAVLSATTAGERSAVHATAAVLLRGRGAVPERVASHLLATEPASDPATIQVLRAAATRAVRRGAPEIAVRLLERAVAEPPAAATRGELVAALADARHQAGHSDEQTIELYREACRLVREPVRRGELLRDLAWVIGPSRLRQHELAPLLEEAIGALSQVEGVRALSLQLQAALLTGTMLTAAPGATGQQLEGIDQLDGCEPAAGPLIAWFARCRLSSGAPAAEVAKIGRRAIANPQTLIDEGPDSLWLLNSVVILVQADCLDDAEALLARALDRARELGSPTGFALVSTHRARVALRRGALRDAEAEARGALEALIERSWYTTSATAMLIDALMQQGRLHEAQAAYDELRFGEQIPDQRPATPMLIARGRLREQQGDLQRAAHDLTEAVARIARFNVRNAVGLDARLSLIYVQRALGALATARAGAREASRIATAWGAPGAIGEALRAESALTNDDEQSIGLLREAVQQLDRSPARLEHAHALADLGAALRRTGQRTESRPPLRAALALAEEVGAAPLAQRAREELAASGLRLRRQSEDRDRLTPSEQRIARLAAEGSTNPQIGQSLFLTIKTVEGHLSSVYRKLGIAGRRELASALEQPAA